MAIQDIRSNVDLARGQLPSYTRTITNTNIAPRTPQRSETLLESAYSQIMGRAAGRGQQKLSRGGMYASMPDLEEASMRLADAALGREMLAGEYRGSQEKGLQELRGAQELDIQNIRGSQERSSLGVGRQSANNPEIRRLQNLLMVNQGLKGTAWEQGILRRINDLRNAA